MNALLDKDFLQRLDHIRNKQLYVEIISLDMYNHPLEKIEGRITQGSITIDGLSSVRRTCSLTIVAEELNIHEFYWGLKTKFKLAIGVENNIDTRYPEVIWFKQGVFVISSFNTSQAISTYTINIQGKDKMSLLNGDLGGTIMSLTHDFGKVSTISATGVETIESLPLKDIIMGAVSQFAQEPMHNIIINDLDDYGLELMEYRGKNPLYFLIDMSLGEPEPVNIIVNENQTYQTLNGNQTIAVKDIPVYNPFFILDGPTVNPTLVVAPGDASKKPYSIAKLEFGNTAGYRLTDLVYAGDLILNAGQPITAMLDKIINMLGMYEYFYDIEGRFIFQRKRATIHTLWNNRMASLNEEEYIQDLAYISNVSYNFHNGDLILSYSNDPQFSNIRNDFSVWGTRMSVNGAEIPIHMRYAIDKKPKFYITYDGICYSTMSMNDTNAYINDSNYSDTLLSVDVFKENENLDWREIIYQMALDYNKNHVLKEDFFVKLDKNNFGFYPNGKTGYEQYYIDMEGFWRQLYNPDHTTQYEAVAISRTTYNDTIAKGISPFPYYYAKDKFAQCTNDMTFKATQLYYSVLPNEEGNNTMTPLKELTRFEYETTADKSIYWYMDPADPYEIVGCLIKEPYRSSGTGYYNSKYESISFVAEIDYNGNENKYYYRKGMELKPCVSLLQYNKDYIYYEDEEGTKEKVQLGKTAYDASPWIYYYRQGVYTKCTAQSVYDANETYYLLSAVSGSDEKIYVKPVITQEMFERNRTQYYIRRVDLTKRALPCVIWNIEYSADYRFYTIKDETLIAISDKQDFINRSKDGSLAYAVDIFECCQHYIEYNTSIHFYQIKPDIYSSEDHWNTQIVYKPDTLNFWFDFLDDDSELQNYGGHAIGNRPKSLKDDRVKGIYFRETPNLILVDKINLETAKKFKLGYTYLQLDANLLPLFSISAQGKSAKDVVDELIQTHLCEGEQISFTCLPIYHLVPNTKIIVRNDESAINGEYLLSRYTINLGINANMSISASRLADKLY